MINMVVSIVDPYKKVKASKESKSYYDVENPTFNKKDFKSLDKLSDQPRYIEEAYGYEM